jgi:hypothetical protein
VTGEVTDWGRISKDLVRPKIAAVCKTLISGFPYIDTYNGVVLTGGEVVRIPYSY